MFVHRVVARLRGSPVRLALALVLTAAVTAGCGHASTSSPVSAARTGVVTVPSSTTLPSGTGPGPASKQPNIVFVLTDDLSDNLVTPQFMPNLWNLEHDGTSFSRYFVTDSLCCPSRASIFTGRYPHDTGVFTNNGRDGGYDVFDSRGDDNSTVATDLQRAGYRTALMGKYLNLYEPEDPAAPGWDEWDVAGNAGYNEFNYSLNEDGHIVTYGGRRAATDDYLTDVLSGRANGFIRSTTTVHRSSPFFLEVATYAPHAPYVPAPRDDGLYPGLRYPRTPAWDRATTHAPKWLAAIPPLTAKEVNNQNEAFRLRAEAVKSVDDMIGQLVATLRATGEWDNTYLVFSSDNGYHMGEHQLLPGKLTALDTDIHVPLLVVGPRVAHNRIVRAFAENIDLRPTFDGWAGTKPDEAIDGRSLEPLLADPAAPAGWPQGVLIEHHGPDLVPSDPDYPPADSGNPTSYEALRLSGALYVEYVDGEREYYDLVTDPYELHNIYGRLGAAYVGELHAELRRVERCDDAPACGAITTPIRPG